MAARAVASMRDLTRMTGGLEHGAGNVDDDGDDDVGVGGNQARVFPAQPSGEPRYSDRPAFSERLLLLLLLLQHFNVVRHHDLSKRTKIVGIERNALSFSARTRRLF